MRRPLTRLHRWFGLVAGLWLFVMAATGSVLVFYAELDHALNPGFFRASVSPARDLDGAIAAARAVHPEATPTYVDLPGAPGDALRVSLEADDLPYGLEVHVDPASHELLGAREWGVARVDALHLMPFLYKLHYTLHAGETVAWLLGVVALLWAIDHFVGAALSFPSRTRWRDSFRVAPGARGHRLNFGLHRAAGLWLVPVTLTLAVTGVYFNMYDEFRAVVGAVSPLTPRFDETRPALARPLAAPPLSFTQAIAAARPAAPGQSVDGVGYDAGRGLYRVRFHDPRDLAGYGTREIHVDARSGAVLSDRHPTVGTAGDIVMAWQYPLHSGKAFGWPGRIAVFVAGVATCALVVTGWLIWARKARARRAAVARRRGPAGHLPPLPVPAE